MLQTATMVSFYKVWFILLQIITCLHGNNVYQFSSLRRFNSYKKLHNLKEKIPLYIVWLTEAYNSNGARCLDGTTPAFYFRPGIGDGINKFHIHLQGGGWCAGYDRAMNVSGMSDCYDRALNSDVGSSKTWLPYMTVGGYMSDDKTENPLSYNWNIAYLKYCDGASFSGNNDTTITHNNLTLYFRGFRILKGALDLLNKEYGFNNHITDVLFSGGSAGALGTFIHTQYIYNDWILRLNASANFMSMPDAGFFLEYEGPNRFITGMKWIYYNQNVTVAMNKDCMKYYQDNNNNEWKCMFAQNIAPFISLPLPGMFPLQSRYDSFQIKFELDLDQNSTNIDSIDEYGANFTTTFINDYIRSNKNRSAFLDACSHHVMTSWSDDNITINKTAAKNASVQWYYNIDNIWNWKPEHNTFWFGNETYPCHTCGCPNNN